MPNFWTSGRFLRIRGGDEPLDATGLHPENYEMVKQWFAGSNWTTISTMCLVTSQRFNNLTASLVAAANDEVNDAEQNQRWKPLPSNKN